MKKSKKSIVEYVGYNLEPQNSFLYSGITTLASRSFDYDWTYELDSGNFGGLFVNNYMHTNPHNYFMDRYGDAFLYERFGTNIEEEQGFKRYITEIFMEYCNVNAYSILHEFETTLLYFNPLFNVDGKEVTTYNDVKDTFNNGKTITHTDTQHIKEETKNSNATTINYGIDSTGTMYEESKSTIGYGSTTSPNPTSERSVVSGNIVDANSGVDTNTKSGSITLERGGNIGVTKSTDLIDSARATYMWSFWDYLFKGFINTYGTFSEVEEW